MDHALDESGNIVAGSCTYRQANDDPHGSGEKSVHGYWLYVAGTCPSMANVDIELQAYWCDSLGCRWLTVASGSGDYLAGGGSGRRSNARINCSNSTTVGWRGATDVDLIGVADPSGWYYGGAVNRACSP
ncbi:hypothetical protein [Micromonospora sp. NPDC049662]|uniref:hypothetical protein n=1 Tax=Micromonospora sp. NPDC049662 TaxID=3155397 RepID=UPI0034443F6E